MKKLFRYMKGLEKECIFGPLFKLLEASFELLIPLIVARIVDWGIRTGDIACVIRMCLTMIALGALGLCCSVTAQFFAAKASVEFVTRLRHAVMEHLLGLSYVEIDQMGTSTMMTRLTSDINQIQNGVNLTLRLLLRSPFVVFGAMIMAFTIDFESAMIFVCTIPVLCLIVFGIMLVTIPLYQSVQKRLDRVTAATREHLAGVRVLRSFCKEQDEVRDYIAETSALTKQQLFVGRISALMNPVTFVVINIAVIVLLHKGALRINAGILSQGLVIALYNYICQILVELIKMANLIITMTKAAACSKRIEDILNISSSQMDGNFVPLQIKGSVEFQDVTVRYQRNSDVSLNHISFTVQAGETVGIIGGTGSGKTTLIHLIPRFYDAVSGSVSVDGINVKCYDRRTFRQNIGIVPQNPILFHGTVRQNLLWGNENADDNVLMEALEVAQAKDFVLERNGGLDSEIAQGGTDLSGGQRQRLTIARALVRKPAILILDDSTSALDYATDAKLRASIRNRKPVPTTFIVSQRTASVRNADKIVVLDDGRITGIGTHDSLLKSCQVYQEIYYSQFPKGVD